MDCTGMDDFSGSVSGDSIVEAVLNHCVEIFGSGCQAVIVDAAFGIDVGYLLPDATLAGSDRANSFQELAEIIASEHCIALFQAVIIKNETFAYKLIENPCSPNSKGSGPPAIDSISYTDNGIKVLKIHTSRLSFTLNCPMSGGYFHFGNNHIFLKFTFLKNIFQVFVYSRHSNIKQLRHSLLREP